MKNKTGDVIRRNRIKIKSIRKRIQDQIIVRSDFFNWRITNYHIKDHITNDIINEISINIDDIGLEVNRIINNVNFKLFTEWNT